MSAFPSLLFPAYSLTTPLIFGACGSGLVVALGLQCVTRRPNLQAKERYLKALGYGGTFGVAACIFILMAFEGTGRPKLTPAELANTAVLGFVTAGLVALLVLGMLSWLVSWWDGSPGKEQRPLTSRPYGEPIRSEISPRPAISTRRASRG